MIPDDLPVVMVKSVSLVDHDLSRVEGADPYAGRGERQWWLVAVLTLTATLGAMDRQVLSLLTNAIKTDLHLTDTQFSFVYGGAFAIANILFMIPAGFLADRRGRRRLMVIGVTVWSFMGLLCGVAGSFLQLFLARAGVGFGESVIQPVSVSMLRSALPGERRGRGFSIFAMAITTGSALALLLGGALVHTLMTSGVESVPIFGRAAPWRIVLFVLALAGAPILLLLLTVREPLAAPVREREGGYGAVLIYIRRYWQVFVPLLLFNPIVGMVTLSYGAWTAPILIRAWGLSIPEVGAKVGLLMLLLPPIGLFIIGNLIDSLIRRYGARGPVLVAIPTVTLFGVVHFLCPLMTAAPAFWTLLALVMLMGGTCFPIGNTIISLTTPPQLVGKMSAIQYILYGIIGATVGPTVVAMVSDNFFDGPRAIGTALGLVSGVYATAALVASVVLERQLRPRRAELEANAAGGLQAR